METLPLVAAPQTVEASQPPSPRLDTAALVYKKHGSSVHALYHWLLGAEQARISLSIFASRLLKAGRCPYTRFERAWTLRIALDSLPNEVMLSQPLHQRFRTADAATLYMRDALDLSPDEISAITGHSLGSILTRLQATRGRLFGDGSPLVGREIPNSSHRCVLERDRLEVIPLEGVSPIQGGACTHCQQYLALRSQSAEYFQTRIPPLPGDLEDIPAAPLVVRQGNRTLFNWAAAPWYVRVLLEGLTATAVVMGIVFSVPRLKAVYELWLEKRVDLASLTELAASLTRPEPAAPPSTLAAPTPAAPYGPKTPDGWVVGQKQKTTVTSEFSEREGTTTAAASHKVYRILIKTDSPDTLKNTVHQLLSNMQASASQAGAEMGVELPGGVMFDAYVPVKAYKGLVSELGRFGEMKIIITQSRSRVVPGKARIKIWLQRI